MITLKTIFLFLCLTPIFLQAQPEIAWQRCYGGSDYDWFIDAIVTHDNGILASIDNNYSTDGDLEGQIPGAGWVVKFDSTLEIQWQKFYNTDSCRLGFSQIMQLDNGDFVFGGGGGGAACIGSYEESGDFALIKMNSSGEMLFYHLYGSPGSEIFDSFIKTMDGGFLIAGESNSSGGDIPFHYEGDMGSTDAIIFKTDSVGNLQWLRNLGGSGYDEIIGNPVEIVRGQYVVSIGSSSTDHDLAASGIAGIKRWTIVMDSLGEIIREGFISINDLSNSDGSTLFYKNAIMIVGQSHAESLLFPAQDGHALEEGALGFIDTSDLQLTNIISFGGSGYDLFRRYARDEQGNYYFLGISKSQNYDLPGNYNDGEASDYWILATDSNFHILWSRNFGGADDCGDLACSQFYGALLYKDNMLYAFVKSTVPDVLPDMDIQCGHLNPGADYDTDAWLVAFDLSTGIPEQIDMESAFEIYPNPTSGNFAIVSSDYPPMELTICIYDIAGKIVYSEMFLSGGNHNVDMQSLPRGIFSVSVKQDNAVLYQTKIVLQ